MLPKFEVINTTRPHNKYFMCIKLIKPFWTTTWCLDKDLEVKGKEGKGRIGNNEGSPLVFKGGKGWYGKEREKKKDQHITFLPIFHLLERFDK